MARHKQVAKLPPYWLDPDESWRLFDAQVRQQLGITGREFMERLDKGEYRSTPDDLEHAKLMYLLVLADSFRD